MKNKTILVSLFILSTLTTFAQQIPIGSCGFVYIHDEAGNRIKRTYFCNNGTDPYPEARESVNNVSNRSIAVAAVEKNSTVEFQPVDAIYPNPTTGIFYIEFNSKLVNSNISILDANGKVMQKYTASGNKLTCNLSSVAAGVYFVRIEDKGLVITKKIVKQ